MESYSSRSRRSMLLKGMFIHCPCKLEGERLTCAQAWVYAHIQLTPEEAAEYKGVPVVYNGEVGFFFEPNE